MNLLPRVKDGKLVKQQAKPKKIKKTNNAVQGDRLCKSCKIPMYVKEKQTPTKKQLKKSYYYLRTYYCKNKQCRVGVVNDETSKVYNLKDSKKNISTLRKKRFKVQKYPNGMLRIQRGGDLSIYDWYTTTGTLVQDKYQKLGKYTLEALITHLDGKQGYVMTPQQEQRVISGERQLRKSKAIGDERWLFKDGKVYDDVLADIVASEPPRY